jgi:alkylhydroperoxidase family enzyme
MTKRIEYIDYQKADAETKKAFDDRSKADGGYVTNMKKTLLRSLPAFQALMEWYPLHEELKKFLDARSITIFCHAISTENDCLICSTFFRRNFAALGVDLATLEFTEVELLLENFGRRLAHNPNDVDDELFAKLKNHFKEEQLVLLTAFAGLMIATNVFNNALKVDLDQNLFEYRKES